MSKVNVIRSNMSNNDLLNWHFSLSDFMADRSTGPSPEIFT